MTSADGSAPDLAVVLEQVRQLTDRLAILEDERAITAVLTSYGFGVDSDSPDGTAALYAEDTRIDIDQVVVIEGRSGVRDMVSGPEHQAILPGCAHIMGPFVITVDGDHATAIGYATTYVRDGDGPKLWRQSAGRWDLARSVDGWEVTRRRSESLGTPASQDVLRSALRPS